MKTIVLTGGGTAGHVTPNLALLPKLAQAGFRIHYVGLRGGMEEALVRKAGLPFHGIQGGKLRRYADFRNFTDLFRISAGFFESVRLLRELKPDVVFSKGGFVSTPVVWAASICRLPVVTHESDMTVGLANRLTAPFATKICYTFPETASGLPEGKGVFTGLPIREELLRGSRQKGLALCGFAPGRPVLVAVGGSQGSAFINAMLRSCLPQLLRSFQVCHVCGKGNLDEGLAHTPGYRQFEYITDTQPDLYAMADIMLTRGGATSLYEILALQKPHVIIPYSLKASRGDQILNARSFVKQGFGEMLSEEDEAGRPLSASVFQNTLIRVYNDRARYVAAMGKSEVRGGLENVVNVILQVAGKTEN